MKSRPTNTSSVSQNQHKLTCSSLSPPPLTVVQPVIPDDCLLSHDAMALTSSTLSIPPPQGVVGILQDNIIDTQDAKGLTSSTLTTPPPDGVVANLQDNILANHESDHFLYPSPITKPKSRLSRSYNRSQPSPLSRQVIPQTSDDDQVVPQLSKSKNKLSRSQSRCQATPGSRSISPKSRTIQVPINDNYSDSQTSDTFSTPKRPSKLSLSNTRKSQNVTKPSYAEICRASLGSSPSLNSSCSRTPVNKQNTTYSQNNKQVQLSSRSSTNELPSLDHVSVIRSPTPQSQNPVPFTPTGYNRQVTYKHKISTLRKSNKQTTFISDSDSDYIPVSSKPASSSSIGNKRLISRNRNGFTFRTGNQSSSDSDSADFLSPPQVCMSISPPPATDHTVPSISKGNKRRIIEYQNTLLYFDQLLP